MKKVKILGLMVVMVVGLTACGNKEVEAPVEPVETPVVEEVNEEEPVVEEPVEAEPVEEEEYVFDRNNKPDDYTEEEWQYLLDEMDWFDQNLENKPEPTEEEKAVFEAELKAEVEAGMGQVEELVKNWLDIAISPDKEYTYEERIADLVEKKVIINDRNSGSFGETSLDFEAMYGTVTKYTVDRLEFREEELEFNDSAYTYWSRRNIVPFYLDLTLEYEKDGEKGTKTLNWIIYGPYRNGEFRGWRYDNNYDM